MVSGWQLPYMQFVSAMLAEPLKAGNHYLGVSAGGNPEKQASGIICVRSGFTHTVQLKLYGLENRNRKYSHICNKFVQHNYTPEPA